MFITVDKTLDDLDKEKKDTIDIFGFVKDMRTRRMNMVQTAVGGRHVYLLTRYLYIPRRMGSLIIYNKDKTETL